MRGRHPRRDRARARRVVLDAADLAAPVLGASHAQAQRRVELAVRLAVGREPVPADGRATAEANGLGGVHDAMAEGRLDGYRASVIADRARARAGRGRRGHRGRARRAPRTTTPPPCAGAPGGWSPASRPTCCASAPSGRVPRPGCAAGSPSLASTPGSAPSPARMPRPRGPRSTGSPTTWSPTAPARTSSRPAARRSPTSSSATRRSTCRSCSPSRLTVQRRRPTSPASPLPTMAMRQPSRRSGARHP